MEAFRKPCLLPARKPQRRGSQSVSKAHGCRSHTALGRFGYVDTVMDLVVTSYVRKAVVYYC